MAEAQNGPAGQLQSPADVKRKQLFLLAVVGIGVLLAAFFTTLFADGNSEAAKRPARKEPLTKTNIATAGSRVDPQEAWIGVAGQQIASLEKEKQALDDRLRKLEEKQSKAAAAAPAESLTPLGALPPAQSLAPPPIGADPAKGPMPMVAGSFAEAPAAPAPMIATVQISQAAPAPVVADAGTAKTSGTATGSTAAAPAAAASPSAPPNSAPGAARPKDLTREEYLPAGSFFRAVLLSGLDAPTGGQVQANPHPVLLRLLDNAILPNHFRGQVKECFIVAAGYGDMSSERAYLRTESLSCVNGKGQVIDVTINGWAIGDDGKAGIRGRVVSKQGQALANAMLSGVMSGIGSAIRESAVNTHVGPTGGVVQVPKPGAEFRAGFGTGVADGLDRLTDYYIKLAERMFPVVEVDAGRVVDIALNKGVSLQGLFKQDTALNTGSAALSALGRRRGELLKAAPREEP